MTVNSEIPSNIVNGVIKVSSKSSPKNLAGLLVAVLKERKKVELHTIGASSLNQAVKSIAIARGLVAPNGYDLINAPSFIDLEIDGEEKTGIRLLIEYRVDS